MRLVVARCEVTYTGRLTAYLPEAIRLLVFKADGSVLVHADSGGYKPLNWMTPPTVVEDGDGSIVVRKRAGRSEDRLEIRIAEVLAEFEHELGEDAGLEKDGVERHLQEALAERPDVLEDGLRLVRREWPTEIGPVDLMCRDADDGWVAVEIKRVGTIEAVEQLSRYLEVIRPDPSLAECRGILAAQSVKPQASTLCEARGLGCVEVDLDLLRGDREPELTLFEPEARLRPDGGLEVVAGRIVEERRDALEPDVVRHEPLERIRVAREEAECRAEVARGVMERADEPDLLVVDPVRVDRDARSAREAAEREHRAAGADEPERGVPGLLGPGRLDHDVCPLRLAGAGPEERRQLAPLRPPTDDHRAPARVGHAGAQHQPDRSGTDDRHGVAVLHARDVDAVEAARERLGHRGDLRRKTRRDGEEVPARDPLRHEKQLGVRAVEEREEALAERLLPARARRARPARSGVRDDDAAPRGDVGPADLVAERARRRPEQDRVPAAVRLQVGAVGEGHLDLEEHLALGRCRLGNVLEPQVPGAVEDQCAHRPHRPAPPIGSTANGVGTSSSTSG